MLLGDRPPSLGRFEVCYTGGQPFDPVGETVLREQAHRGRLCVRYDHKWLSAVALEIPASFNRSLAGIETSKKNEEMRYEKVAEDTNTQFRRITGVKRETFRKLEYLREYQTYAHIAASYRIAKGSIYREIKWVEDMLIRDGTFSLPERKAQLKSDMEDEAILADMTGSPTERSKKARAVLFREGKRHTLKTRLLVSPESEADTGYSRFAGLHINSSLQKAFKETSIDKAGVSGKQGDPQTAYFRSTPSAL